MKIFIISDLHLEASETLGTFAWDQDEFIAMMETVRKFHAIDKVILNGDTFDLCKSAFKDIAVRNGKLLGYFNEIKALFIKGNHDSALPFGQKHFGVINGKGEKIYIEHGHRGDFINGTAAGRLIGKMFYKILLCVAGIPFIRALYYGYLENDEGFKGHRKYNSYKYLRHAVRLHRKYDVVILGHTHKMERHDTYSRGNYKRYFNSGSCSFGRFQGIVLDTETLEHRAIRFDPPQASTKYAKPVSRPGRAPILSVRPVTGSTIAWAPSQLMVC
jgi:predicted phosphodiesterase